MTRTLIASNGTPMLVNVDQLRQVLKAQPGNLLLGLDECGYGSWAGEITACAVVAPRSWAGDARVRDSKKLSKAQREQVWRRYGAIGAASSNVTVDGVSFFVGIGSVSASEVDSLGAGEALKEAHRRAYRNAVLNVTEQPFVVIDGIVDPGLMVEAHCLPKADALVPVVALASIIGKVYRDRLMAELDKVHPGYGFAAHMGYGTATHQAALAKLGVSPVHRKSYAPIAKLLPREPVSDFWDDFE
jgi:ribonuclease HII